MGGLRLEFSLYCYRTLMIIYNEKVRDLKVCKFTNEHWYIESTSTLSSVLLPEVSLSSWTKLVISSLPLLHPGRLQSP